MNVAQKLMVIGTLTASLSLGVVSAPTVGISPADEGTETTLLTRKVNEYEGQHRKTAHIDQQRKVNEYEGQHRKVNEYEGQHRKAAHVDQQRKVNEYEGQH